MHATDIQHVASNQSTIASLRQRIKLAVLRCWRSPQPAVIVHRCPQAGN